MKVEIYSRDAIEELMRTVFPENTAIISFFSPKREGRVAKGRVDFSGVCEDVFYVMIPDIDIEILGDYGYTYDTYFEDASELAAFIYGAKEKGKDIICQCDFGQSRSAASAAAILQHFEKCGIDVFADYRYYPNQLVYNKLFLALEDHKRSME